MALDIRLTSRLMDFVEVKWLSDDGMIVYNSSAPSFVSFKDFCHDLIMLIDLNSKHRCMLLFYLNQATWKYNTLYLTETVNHHQPAS